VEGCAYWIEVGAGDRGRPGRVTLACSPIEVAPLLRQRLLDQAWSVTLTSATLAAGGRPQRQRRRPAPAPYAADPPHDVPHDIPHEAPQPVSRSTPDHTPDDTPAF